MRATWNGATRGGREIATLGNLAHRTKPQTGLIRHPLHRVGIADHYGRWIIKARASGNDTNQPYSDVLMRREQLLWERQEELAKSQTAHFESSFKSLLSQHAALLDQVTKERASWEGREQNLITQINALQDENQELRHLLLQAYGGGSALAGLQQPAQPQQLESAASNSVDANSPSLTAAAAPPQQQQQQLSSPSTPPQTPAATTTGGSDYRGAFKQGVELPSWASDIQAAMSAVDEIDVLTTDVNYSNTANKVSTATSNSATSPAQTTTPVAAAEQQQEEEEVEIEAPRGPPPTMSLGADDIFWVNQLHTALADAGYYPGDEDIDDYFYGEGTQSAVLTYQCCEGLTETGVVDETTWMKLLGPSLQLKESRDLFEDNSNTSTFGTISTNSSTTSTATSAPTSNSSSTTQKQQQEESAGKKPYAELFSSLHETSTTIGPHGELEIDDVVREQDTVAYTDGSIVEENVTRESHSTILTAFPVLMDGDGGREVHSLHVAMSQQGYYPGEDDLQWWQFGDATANALKTFQACNGLPETGVCDVTTWRKLLGEDASPSDVLNLQSGNSDDEDLAFKGDMVWLMGEQRWEDRSKSNRQSKDGVV